LSPVTAADGRAIARRPPASPHRNSPNRAHRRIKPLRLRLIPYLFILPNMAIFAVFTIYPAINGFNISLYKSSDARNFTWAGNGNYTQILHDDAFWAVVRNTVLFTSSFVTIAVSVAIAIAVLLQAQRRAKGFFRAVVFVPVLISPVVVGLVWNWILQRKGGLLNSGLASLGLGQPGWLVEPNLALGAIVIVAVWMHAGFFILILLAGLQGIDPVLYEAAAMDGASAWVQFRAITLPMLSPSIVVVVVLATINGFQAYDYIYTLTGGGPDGASTLLVQYIYDNAFRSPIRYGFAAAASVLLFATIFAVTLINWLVGRRREAV
jgi:alpha-1,4-digalacturonate transport system permease protein